MRNEVYYETMLESGEVHILVIIGIPATDLSLRIQLIERAKAE